MLSGSSLEKLSCILLLVVGLRILQGLPVFTNRLPCWEVRFDQASGACPFRIWSDVIPLNRIN